MMGSLAMTVLFSSSFFLLADGNELSVAAQVDKTEVATGQPLLFSITIAGQLQETPKVDLTSFEGFQIVATAQSQQIQIERGQMRQALTLTYTLAPTTPGTHTLGPVKVEYQGEVYETKPIEVKVVEGRPRQKESPRRRAIPKRREGPELKGGVIL